MSFIRKMALFAVLTASSLSPLGSLAEAQQKSSVTAQISVAETAFRNWIASFEKSGAKIGQFTAGYDVASDTLKVEALSITWPQSVSPSGSTDTLRFEVGHLSIKTFRADGKGIAFQALTAEALKIFSSSSLQSQLKLDQFTVGAGRIPSLAGFVSDPAKPFTTQVRLMRLLAGAEFSGAAAKTIQIGETVSIRNASLDALSGGKVGSLTIEGLSTTPVAAATTGQSATTVEAGLVNIANIDFDRYLRLFEPSAYLDSGSGRPWSSIIEAITIHQIRVGNGPLSAVVEKAQAGPVKVKQFDEDQSSTFDKAGADPEFLAANPQIAQKLASAVRNSFTVDTISADAIAIAGQNQNGSLSAQLAKAVIDNFNADSIARARASDLFVSDATGEVKLASLDVVGINLLPVSVDGGKTSRASEVAGTVAPAINSIKADGLSLKLQETAVSLGSLDLAMAYFIGATPTNVKLKLGGLKFAAGQVTNPAIRQALTDLGYSDVDLSIRISGNWDDTSSSILLDDLTVIGADMGTLSLSGSFAGITRAGLQSPTSILPQELSKAGVRNLRLILQNDSLFDRFIAKVAQANGKSVDELKKTLSTNIPNMFAGITPAALRNKFVFAATGFLNSPQILTFGATPTDVVPIQEALAGIQSPSTLPSLLNIDVSANNRRQ